jgi:quinol-cytochrome oxidoreductase complex cytochrome b subunit
MVWSSATSVLYTICLGGLSFLSFIVLALSGILLMFHYVPGSGSFSSILNTHSVIPFGDIIRSLHYWAGQIMVLTVTLHMLRVLWTKSYKPPRELNWVIGITLLILTLFLDFTGFLLRGSQESTSAGSIAYNLVTLIPGIGSSLAYMIFGEPTAPGNSSLKVYVFHCVVLPFIASFLQAYHFWNIRKDGGVKPL